MSHQLCIDRLRPSVSVRSIHPSPLLAACCLWIQGKEEIKLLLCYSATSTRPPHTTLGHASERPIQLALEQKAWPFALALVFLAATSSLFSIFSPLFNSHLFLLFCVRIIYPFLIRDFRMIYIEVVTYIQLLSQQHLLWAILLIIRRSFDLNLYILQNNCWRPKKNSTYVCKLI